MIRFVSAVGVGLLAPIGAQMSATVQVAQDVQASIRPPLRIDSIPFGTSITGPRSLDVREGTGFARWDIARTGSFAFEANCSAGAGIWQWATADGVLEWTVAAPVSGWLTLDVSCGWLRGGSSVSCAGPGIDLTLRNDSGWPWGSATRRLQQRIQASTGSFTLRCSFSIAAAGSAVGPYSSASAGLRLEFSPGLTPVRQTTYGDPCGMNLIASDRPTPLVHELSFDVQNAFASSPVLLLFGGRRASIPIGSSPCLLRTEPIAVVVLGSNVSGDARWRIDLPGPLRSPLFDLQAVSLDAAWQVRASHGLELQFVD